VTPNLKEIAFKVFKEKREIIPDKTQFYAQDSSSRGGGLRGGRGGGRTEFRCASQKTCATQTIKTIPERDETKLPESSNTERMVIFHDKVPLDYTTFIFITIPICYGGINLPLHSLSLTTPNVAFLVFRNPTHRTHLRVIDRNN